MRMPKCWENIHIHITCQLQDSRSVRHLHGLLPSCPFPGTCLNMHFTDHSFNKTKLAHRPVEGAKFVSN